MPGSTGSASGPVPAQQRVETKLPVQRRDFQGSPPVGFYTGTAENPLRGSDASCPDRLIGGAPVALPPARTPPAPSAKVPRRAASMVAMSTFSFSSSHRARLAAARSGSVVTSSRVLGVISQDKPHLSLHHPHALSVPPLLTIAFQ